MLGLADPGQDSSGLAKAPGRPQAAVHIHLLTSSLGADVLFHKGQGIWQEYTAAALERDLAILSSLLLGGVTKGQDGSRICLVLNFITCRHGHRTVSLLLVLCPFLSFLGLCDPEVEQTPVQSFLSLASMWVPAGFVVEP